MIDFRLRRTRWLIGAAVAVVATIAVVFNSSRNCTLVVYNESAEQREGVSVMASGFSWRVDSLPARGSRHTTVSPGATGTTFVMHLGRSGDSGHEIWFEPKPGRKLIVRIWPDGLIESDVRFAWWE